MRVFVLSAFFGLLACGFAAASPSTFDCIDPARRTHLTAEINTDLQRTGVPYTAVQLSRAHVDFQKAECRFSALYSTGETRTLLLRILGDVDGAAEYELELDELLTAIGGAIARPRRSRAVGLGLWRLHSTLIILLGLIIT
jgi:hypothetical protein